MVRTEISLFLKNAPGELGKLAALISDAGINIDALTSLLSEVIVVGSAAAIGFSVYVALMLLLRANDGGLMRRPASTP